MEKNLLLCHEFHSPPHEGPLSRHMAVRALLPGSFAFLDIDGSELFSVAAEFCWFWTWLAMHCRVHIPCAGLDFDFRRKGEHVWLDAPATCFNLGCTAAVHRKAPSNEATMKRMLVMSHGHVWKMSFDSDQVSCLS